MAEIRILNGDNVRLRRLLGDLADRLELKTGDTAVKFALEVEAEAAVGRDVFKRLITRGRYVAFAPGEGGGPGRQVREWDPVANPLVFMVAPLVGG